MLLMMKKIQRFVLFLGVFSVLIFAYSCQKDQLEVIPLEPSFQDPAMVLEDFRNRLDRAENGLEYTLYIKGKGFYAGYLQLQMEQNSKFMIDAVPAVFDVTCRTTVQSKQPIFSWLPSEEFAQIIAALGDVDTTFTFLALAGDTILLRGNQYGNELRMLPAGVGASEKYLKGGMLQKHQLVNSLQFLPYYFKRFVLNGAAYDLHINPAWRKVYIHSGGEDRFRIHESNYAVNASGLVLQTPFQDGVNNFTTIAIDLDNSSGQYRATIRGVDVPLTNESKPSAYDTQAHLDFFERPFHSMQLNLGNNNVFTQSYSAVQEGFTIAGVPDAYGLQQIPDIRFLVFFHRWLDNEYGTLRLFFNNNTISSYGPATFRQYDAGAGVIRFQLLGHFGETPEALKPILDPTIAALTDTYGYYVIKSGPASFDLVSYAGAIQKWVRFQ